MEDTARRILEGAIDTHVHSSPDVAPRRVDDLALARAAAEAGMAGLVLKNHHAPTQHRAYLVEQIVPGVRVLGGLALNGTVGGINPEAVEAAVRTGARIVWMPTISAANQLEQAKHNAGRPHPGVLKTPTQGIRVGDPRLSDALDAVLELVRDGDVVLATGHLAADETALLVDRAQRAGVRKILVTHPDAPAIAMPIAQQQALAARGVFLERCYNILLPPRKAISFEQMASTIRAVGIGSTIVASDLGQADNPDPVTGFGDYLASLQAAGLSEPELRVVARENAQALFGF